MENKAVNDDRCFCCGKENDRGLKLLFSYPEKGTAETMCEIPAYFTGWRSMVHGGFLAMLLDETMAHACMSGKKLSVTAELTVRYLKPVKAGESVKVKGKIKEIKSRIVETRGWIYNGDRQVIAKGKALFLES